MKTTLLSLISLLFSLTTTAQAFLQTPIEGKQGVEWIIVNYVDWGTVQIFDYNCGSKTYKGHQGTDYVIRSFKQMDSGVNVLAAAAGKVIFVQDGKFDRETDGDVSKLLGNYIGIKHANNYYSYYGHLKKNSILLQVGDSVQAGEVIAQVGSSGNSTDPHLHFELWYDSLFVVDPYAGDCGNFNTLFINLEEYDTSFKVWEYGIAHINNLNINSLRERSVSCIPCVFQPSSDTAINLWAHMYGLQKGKDLRVNWINPSNDLWFTYVFKLDRDYWYYYYWSFINHQSLEPGVWRVELLYDGTKVLEETFAIEDKASSVYKTINPYNDNNLITNEQVRVINAHGKQLSYPLKVHTPPGIYIFIIITRQGNQVIIKKWVD